jgi:hypothetical protein
MDRIQYTPHSEPDSIDLLLASTRRAKSQQQKAATRAVLDAIHAPEPRRDAHCANSPKALITGCSRSAMQACGASTSTQFRRIGTPKVGVR